MEGEYKGSDDGPKELADKLKELQVPWKWGATLIDNMSSILAVLVMIIYTGVELFTTDLKSPDILKIFKFPLVVMIVVAAFPAMYRLFSSTLGHRMRKFIGSGAWCHMNGTSLSSLLDCMVLPVFASGDQYSWTVIQVAVAVSAFVLAIIAIFIICCLFWWKERRDGDHWREQRRSMLYSLQHQRDPSHDHYSWTVIQVVGAVSVFVLAIIAISTTCCLFWWKERRDGDHRREQKRFMLYSLRHQRDPRHEDRELEIDLEKGLGGNVVATVDNRQIHCNTREFELMVPPKIEEMLASEIDSEAFSSSGTVEIMAEK